MKALKWLLPTCLALAALLLQLVGSRGPAQPPRDPPAGGQLEILEVHVARLTDDVARLTRALAVAESLAGRPTPPIPAAGRAGEPETTEGARHSPAKESVGAVAGDEVWRPAERDSPTFDINQDGVVTRDEMDRADELARRAGEFAQNRSPDGSYPILADDFRGSPRLFATMDGDGDGALSEREAVGYFVDSIRQLRRYDQDQDGALTPAEFGHLKSRFDFLDTDHDQKIEAWEINILRARGKW